MALSYSYTYTLASIAFVESTAATTAVATIDISATTEVLYTKLCTVSYSFKFGITGSAGAWSYYEMTDTMSISLMLRSSAMTLLEAQYQNIVGDINNLIANKEAAL